MEDIRSGGTVDQFKHPRELKSTQKSCIPARNIITPLEIESNPSFSATFSSATLLEKQSVSSSLFHCADDKADVIDLCGSDTDSCLEESGFDRDTSVANDDDSFHRFPSRHKKGKRNRIKTKRYCDEVAVTGKDDIVGREATWDDKEHKRDSWHGLNFDSSNDKGEEEEWASERGVNDAWQREATLYDSNREESSSSYDDEDEDSDDSDDSPGNVFQQRKQKKSRMKRKRSTDSKQKYCRKPRLVKSDIEVLPKLSLMQMQTELNKIHDYDDDKNDENGMKIVYQFLVCIMWDCDFRYTLMHHQYKGVLAVAGIDTRELCRRFVSYDEEVKIKLLQLDEDGEIKRKKVCATLQFAQTKGMLLGDDMGLGKTIQGLGGAILRSRILGIQSKVDSKIKMVRPTIIVGPNDAVLEQWEESLLLSGIPARKIKLYWKKDTTLHFGDHFLLLTRYQMMSAVKELLHSNSSNLFPKVDVPLLKQLKNQYNASKGNARNKCRDRGETISQCITRLLRDQRRQWRPAFRTLLIDESHFLRNLESFWGFGSALLGMFAERTVLLSGTPYNNGPQDMATQMTIIDPHHKAANVDWWKSATKKGCKEDVAENIRKWKDLFMLRRTKSLLAHTLPPKVVGTQQVSPFITELSIYLNYEAQFLTTLNEFACMTNSTEFGGPMEIRRMKELFIIIMSKMTLMRMSLIHPILPGGREITILFSPTRRHLLSKYKEAAKETCVCCTRFPSQKNSGQKSNEKSVQELQLSTIDMDDDADDVCLGDDFVLQTGRKQKFASQTSTRKELGNLIPLDSTICYARQECRHYIHEKCLTRLQESDDELFCPRCNDFKSRMQVDRIDALATPYETYCEHICFGPDVHGIKATAKIQAVLQWTKDIPVEDKGIIYSFFKSGLDLLEGILVEHFGIECARFDGDVGTELRAKELSNFKTSKTCRFLLVSVQSGGVGLNIVEANHVAFLDRWFNPCVHAQAEDRCHRLKQTKKVSVKYFDVNMTVDEVMASINAMKKENATVLLADGTDIGAAAENMTYKDLSGMMGNMMRYLVASRTYAFPLQTLPPCGVENLIHASEDTPPRGMASRRRIKTTITDQEVFGNTEDNHHADVCNSKDDDGAKTYVNSDIRNTQTRHSSSACNARMKQIRLQDFDEDNSDAENRLALLNRFSAENEPKAVERGSTFKKKSTMEVASSSMNRQLELSSDDELPTSLFQRVKRSKSHSEFATTARSKPSKLESLSSDDELPSSAFAITARSKPFKPLSLNDELPTSAFATTVKSKPSKLESLSSDDELPSSAFAITVRSKPSKVESISSDDELPSSAFAITVRSKPSKLESISSDDELPSSAFATIVRSKPSKNLFVR